MPGIPTLTRLGQVDCLEFKANLAYNVRPYIRKQNKWEEDGETETETERDGEERPQWHVFVLMTS